MSVPIRTDGYESARSERVNVGGDRYADRTAKYIPGEVLAAYVALDRGLVPDTSKFTEKVEALDKDMTAIKAKAGGFESTGQGAAEASKLMMQIEFYQWLPMIILAIGLIFTPLYIRQLAKNAGPDTPWITHAVVSSMAFLVWAYSIKGSAFQVGYASGIYDGAFAAALLVIFTLASGIFAPSPISKPHS